MKQRKRSRWLATTCSASVQCYLPSSHVLESHIARPSGQWKQLCLQQSDRRYKPFGKHEMNDRCADISLRRGTEMLALQHV